MKTILHVVVDYSTKRKIAVFRLVKTQDTFKCIWMERKNTHSRLVERAVSTFRWLFQKV